LHIELVRFENVTDTVSTKVFVMGIVLSFLFLFRVLPQPTMTPYDREDEEDVDKPKQKQVNIFCSSMIYIRKQI
jgi:hypothetical protein